MRRLSTLILLSTALFAADAKREIREEAKRNAQYHKLASALDTFVLEWAADCKADGKALQQVAPGKLGCVVPSTPASKPEAAEPAPRKDLETKR